MRQACSADAPPSPCGASHHADKISTVLAFVFSSSSQSGYPFIQKHQSVVGGAHGTGCVECLDSSPPGLEPSRSSTMATQKDTLFRSVDMSLTQLYIANEIGREVVSALGEIGEVQFRDVGSAFSTCQFAPTAGCSAKGF